MSLNAFASKAETSAFIVGHSSKDLQIYLLTVLLERQYRHLRLSAFPFFPRNRRRWGLTGGWD